MTIFQIRATSFDGETLPDPDDFLITRRNIEGSDYWIVTDANGDSFETIGAIPMRYLNKALPGPNAYLISGSIAPGVGATSFSLGAAVDLEDGLSDTFYPIGPTKTVDPGEEVRITNMYYGADYVIIMESDGTGGQLILLDFGDIELQPIMSQVELGAAPASTDTGTSGGDDMPWDADIVDGPGTLTLGRWQRYDGTDPFSITILEGADNLRFGVIEIEGAEPQGGLTLVPENGQIEDLQGVVGATAVIDVAGIAILYKYDGENGVWRILSTNKPVPQIALQPAADAAITLLNTTGSVEITVTGAGNEVISTTSSKPGQKVTFFGKAIAVGSRTLALDVGTLTLNATGEGAEVMRNADNTAWIPTLLAGATIV